MKLRALLIAAALLMAAAIDRNVSVTNDALVMGGNTAGAKAAMGLAQMGCSVALFKSQKYWYLADSSRFWSHRYLSPSWL